VGQPPEVPALSGRQRHPVDPITGRAPRGE
jgi:hypothetical protein